MRRFLTAVIAVVVVGMSLMSTANAQDEAEPVDIVTTAVESGEFPTLVAAVEAAGLVETLQGEGPFTVFVPTEDAFAAALEATGLTAEALLADTELLTSILTYHVIPGTVLAADVAGLDGEAVATVQGEEVVVTVDGDAVMIDDATVVATDIIASNGVIHVIDSVLIPPSVADALGLGGDDAAEEEPAEEPPVDIVTTAVESGEFPTLVAAVEAAGLVETLQGEGPFTVFAPTEDAFAAALEATGLTAEELLDNTDVLTQILTYHVIRGNVLGADLAGLAATGGACTATLDVAEEVTISGDGGRVMVNDATVVTTDILASNGIIHVIDGVLLPPPVADALGLDSVDCDIEAGEEIPVTGVETGLLAVIGTAVLGAGVMVAREARRHT